MLMKHLYAPEPVLLYLTFILTESPHRSPERQVLLLLFNFIFKKFLIYYLFIIFIFGCVGSLFLCEGFLQLRRVGATLHCGARASHYRGLSCCGAQAPDAQAQ